MISLDVAAEWLALLLRIREDWGFKSRIGNGLVLTEDFRGSSKYFQANSAKVTQITAYALPTTVHSF